MLVFVSKLVIWLVEKDRVGLVGEVSFVICLFIEWIIGVVRFLFIVGFVILFLVYVLK